MEQQSDRLSFKNYELHAAILVETDKRTRAMQLLFEQRPQRQNFRVCLATAQEDFSDEGCLPHSLALTRIKPAELGSGFLEIPDRNPPLKNVLTLML